jgi:ribosome-associated protein
MPEKITLARQMVSILEDKLGEDILLLDLHGIADFTDYFVLVTGTSDRMLQSLADTVSEKIKEATGLIAIEEGKPDSGWVVLDYGYIVVHVLSSEKRDYYQLEELWNKGKTVLRLQ